LAELGGAEVRVARAGAELERAFAAFLDIEASGWKGGEGTGTAIRLVPEALAFYGGLVATPPAGGALEVSLLVAGERALAGQLCLRVDGTVYLLKIGYDEAARDLVPGSVLQARNL